MSGRSATLASMGFITDVGSETAHTEAMGTRNNRANESRPKLVWCLPSAAD